MHDETFDVAVENAPIVIIASAQGEEILAILGTILTEQFQLDVSNIGVQCDGLKVELSIINNLYYGILERNIPFYQLRMSVFMNLK